MFELRHALLGYLLDSLWQVPLIALATLLCSFALRRASIFERHRLWVGALFACALLPLVSSSGWYGSKFGGALGAWRSKEQSAISFQVDGRETASRLARPEVHLFGLNVGSILLMVWGAFVFYRVASLVWSGWRTRMQVRDARVAELPETASRVWETLQSHFDLVKTRLLISDEMAVPATLGMREAIVLLPSSLVEAEKSELSAIFAHELAHVSRGDFLLNLLYEAVALPLGYNPATFWILRQIAGTREMVCDEIAGSCLGDAQGYARSLLQIAKSLAGRQRGPVPALGIFESGDLEGRIMSLMNGTSRMSRKATAFVVTLCGVFLGAFCVTASAFHFEPKVIAAEELKPFAGTWQWMFKDKPFVTMVLVPSGDHFTGYMTNGYFRNDDAGNMTDAGSQPGTSPVVRSFFAGSVLHVVVQDANDKGVEEWTMTLVGPDKAQFNSADPDRPKEMKPWIALRVPDAAEAPVGADGIYRVGGDVSAPKVIFTVEPEFPKGHKEVTSGICRLSLVVDASGVPQQVQIVKSLGPDFDESAVQAVKQYRFKPALRNDEPVPVRLKIEVNFQRF
jgi:TonB family protein